MARPLEHVLRMTGAQLEDVALAIAAEFTAHDPAAAHERLDSLALGLEGIGELGVVERAEALLDELGRRRRFESESRGGPESLLLDHVIERRRGHPVALAIVYAAVARRAGLTLHPVGNERVVMLADLSARPTIVLDPAEPCRRPPRSIGWLCPHVVGAALLEALLVRYLERGEIETAIRAAKLGLVLPLGPPPRRRLRSRVLALSATLN